MGKKKKKGTKITQRRMPVNWPALLGFCGALLALGVAGYFLSRSQADTTQGITPPVMFSEVMTANTSSVKDDLGQFSDWFEIVNDSERAIDLHDWMVMKEADKVQVFTFDDVQIRPGECLVVFCSDRSQNKPGYALHAPFGLGASGESLILMDGKTLTAAKGIQVSEGNCQIPIHDVPLKEIITKSPNIICCIRYNVRILY